MPVSIKWSNEKGKGILKPTCFDTVPNDGAYVTFRSNCHLDPHNPSLFLSFSIVDDVAHVEVEEKLFEFLFDLFLKTDTFPYK
jgi:hypothetical protein